MNDISYHNWNAMSDKALLATIGNFIQSNRLKRNQSQSEVAKAAGISRSTLSLLERGEKVRLDSLIQVLRTLDLLEVMNAFKVEQEISPIQYAKLKEKERKNAYKRKNKEEDKPDLGW